MALKIQRGKYRVQVSLSEEEYQLLRWLAFEREMTVNELLKSVALSVARDVKSE